MKKTLTLRQVKNEIKRLDPEVNIGEPVYNIQLIMLSALVTGANADKVAKFTKLPRWEVRKFAKKLTQNGIWKNGKTYCGWTDKENGGIAFLLDSMVIMGLLQRK